LVGFANCKINLGLYVVNKRQDGYHDLQTIFYPIKNYFDVIEIQEAKNFELDIYNCPINIPVEKNIIYKAFELIRKKYKISNVKISCIKNLPIGGGMGGGSANATSTLLLLNNFFKLNLSLNELCELALSLGSDCPFFIYNKPCIGNGRGEILTPIELDLSNYKVVLFKPNFGISTSGIFSKIKVQKPSEEVSDLIRLPVRMWKNVLKNQFESVVFLDYPLLNDVKNEMYNLGAVYASMTGTGSTIYGIFENQIDLTLLASKYKAGRFLQFDL
jgi:4-diphosphocytidyl-2-C-methyl-D-erythritol kinase